MKCHRSTVCTWSGFPPLRARVAFLLLAIGMMPVAHGPRGAWLPLAAAEEASPSRAADRARTEPLAIRPLKADLVPVSRAEFERIHGEIRSPARSKLNPSY